MLVGIPDALALGQSIFLSIYGINRVHRGQMLSLSGSKSTNSVRFQFVHLPTFNLCHEPMPICQMPAIMLRSHKKVMELTNSFRRFFFLHEKAKVMAARPKAYHSHINISDRIEDLLR